MLTHLLFMRHAKSSWKDDTLTDHERPLNKRGRKEADIIAHTLCAKGLAPDTIWASDAQRTQETAERLIRIIPGAQTIIKVPGFYHASAASVLDQCAKGESPKGKLMLLGHNPGWSELAEMFTGRSLQMPPACCVIFKLNPDSIDDRIRPENWRLVDLLDARTLLSIQSEEVED